MKVLLPASEVAPIVKLGGLGDVIGSLPKALDKLGVDIDVIVPYYPNAKVDGLKVYKSVEIEVPFDNKSNIVEVFNTKLPGSNVDVLLLRNALYFASGGKDAFQNNVTETQMYAFFDRAVVEYIKSQFNIYDLVHCNDWHTGLITHLLADEVGNTRPATLFTIHNLGYQGVGGSELVQDVGIVPGEHRLIDWDIEDGDLNLLLQGVTSSDFINAVSETYAKEILTEEYGGNLAEVLRSREGRIRGILNGIDYEQFPRDYDTSNWKEKKAEYKQNLQKELNLDVDAHKPLFSFIGRLDPNQKGLDILHESLPAFVEKGAQFILLGSGDSEWEEKLAALGNQAALSKDLSINIAFDVELAQRIYKGSDFLVVPSKYEPCGLIQMIAMWYGTLPVVHATGGLKDSVDDGKTGIVFDSYSSKDFIEGVARGIKLFESPKYNEMVVATMSKDFSWDASAQKYMKLYEDVIKIKNETPVLYDEEEEL